MTKNYEEIFPNSPLVSVSCEIRFPSLLVIKNKIPLFQSEIRNTFQDYYTYTRPNVSKSGVVIDERWWVFKSINDDLNLRVKNSSIVLSSSFYQEFKYFFTLLSKTFEIFFQINDIEKFSRVGLRFTNKQDFEDKTANLQRLNEYFNFRYLKLEPKDNIDNFQIRYSKKKADYNLNILKEYGKNPQNKYSYFFDFDSYFYADIDRENYLKIIENLHQNILEEFHNSITEKYKIEILRSVLE